MKSWVLLLAVLLSARLRLGNAEGDPLPQSLIDLVWDSPISSVEDLKLLLQQQGASTIEDNEDKHDRLLSPTHGRYIRSSPEAQPAQKAECKARAEVMEITRAMVDNTNANFLVWPRCVEVQRCSGCCNSRRMECVPTANTTRNLEVKKVVFKNKKSIIHPVIIPVLEHVTCRMQNVPRSRSSSSSSSTDSADSASLPDTFPPPPQRYPASSPPDSSSKADLHRHDDLKHNQHHHLPHQQDPLESQWQQGSYTQLVRWTQPRVQQAPPYAQTRLTTAGFLGSDGTWPPQARARSPQQDSATSQTYGDDPKAGTEREESGSAGSGALGRVQAADQDHLTEEERRKRLLEMVQSEPEKDPNLHPDQRPKPTTIRSASSTVVPGSSAARQVPFRPASPRRRKRKHRKRISKAAMRAMIM